MRGRHPIAVPLFAAAAIATAATCALTDASMSSHAQRRHSSSMPEAAWSAESYAPPVPEAGRSYLMAPPLAPEADELELDPTRWALVAANGFGLVYAVSISILAALALVVTKLPR